MYLQPPPPQPFFCLLSGTTQVSWQSVPEENFWTLWCKGKLTEADTPTIRSIRTNQCPPPPSSRYFLQAGCPSCRLTNSVKALKTKALKAIIVLPCGWRVWGTSANFNGFRVLALLLQRRQSPEANQTLHDVWPSSGLVRYIYTFGGSCPLAEFSLVQNSLYVLVLHSLKLILAALLQCMALRQRALAKLCSVVQGMESRNFRRGCHLCLAGRPSRWTSAHMSSSNLTNMKPILCDVSGMKYLSLLSLLCIVISVRFAGDVLGGFTPTG